MAKVIYINYGPIPIYELTMGSGKLSFSQLLLGLNGSFFFQVRTWYNYCIPVSDI